MLLSLCLLALVLMALAHWIHEQIVAPSLRISLKYKLFETRDNLYRLKSENPEEMSDEVFDHLLDSVNGTMILVDNLTITDVWDARLILKRSPVLRQQIEQRRRLVRECPVTEVEDIVGANSDAAIEAVVVNCAPALFYITLLVFPIILFAIWWSKIHRALSDLALAGEPRDATRNIVPA